MTAITVASSEFSDSPRERTSTLAINGTPVPRRTPLTPSGVLVRDEYGIITRETKVVVKNGIADVEPSILDFDPCQSIEDGSAWYNLEAAVKDASRILNSLNECNPPSLDDRFRLHVAMGRIRKGADALEGHIARNGLWLSEDEWCECDSMNTWHHF